MSYRQRIDDLVRTKSVIIAMGSTSDWQKEKGVLECSELLGKLGILSAALVVSAHRTPERVKLVADAVESHFSIVRVVIAAAGGAAHLPGMLAAHLYTKPVIGLPVKSSTLSGVDSLYSIVQMPPGVPVATMAIGGGVNAAILAAQILAVRDEEVAARLRKYRSEQTESIPIFPS
jgi:5-(carboxyamino)imidazole ribonucleotide mutase